MWYPPSAARGTHRPTRAPSHPWEDTVQIPITIETEAEDRSWQDYANCLGVDPDLFFPERGASTREAKEVCRGCVVREDCLEFALTNGAIGRASCRERGCQSG